MDIRTERLKSIYPTAPFGILKISDFKPDKYDAFEKIRAKEISKIIPRFENYIRADFVKNDPICHYVKYFKKFKKTFILLQQMESIFVKGLDFPVVPPAVDALILAEMKHGLLVATFDIAKLQEPVFIDVALGDESYISANGKEITLKEGDIFIRDDEGVVLTHVYGQDMITRVDGDSKDIMFVITGVEGVTVDKVETALKDILYYMKAFDKNIVPEEFEVIGDKNQ